MVIDDIVHKNTDYVIPFGDPDGFLIESVLEKTYFKLILPAGLFKRSPIVRLGIKKSYPLHLMPPLIMPEYYTLLPGRFVEKRAFALLGASFYLHTSDRPGIPFMGVFEIYLDKNLILRDNGLK